MNPFEKFLKSKGFSIDAFKALEVEKQADIQNEYLGHIESEVPKSIEEAVKTAKGEIEKDFDEKMKTANAAVEKAVKANADLEEIVKKQGEELVKRAANVNPEGNGMEVAKNMKAQLEELHKDSNKGTISEKVIIKTADTADTAIAVNTHNSIAGAIGTIGNFFAQLIPGIAKKPVAKSNILDYCDVLPLDGDRLVSISETRTTSIAVTAECVAKPVSNVVWEPVNETAQPVATTWKTTTQMRKFFPMFVTSFMNTLQALFDKSVPAAVIAKINSQATSFTPVPAQAVHTNPNNYDALVALIASLIKLGYTPNVAKMSVFAWENLKTLKSSTDGHYMLANNGSINLLTNSIDFGDVSVKIEPDVEFADDAVMVGDLRTAVKCAIDNNLDYIEYFEGDDGKKNLKSHRLEKFFAVNLPTATRTGIIADTFSNVKTLITAV